MKLLPDLRGREARPASPGYNVLKTLGQTVVFWATFLLLLPLLLWNLEGWLGWWRFTHPLWQDAGLILFVLASSLGLYSGITMALQGKGTPLPSDCPRHLVIVGPYRHVRNPMAIAGLSQGVAVGVYLGSPLVVLYALLGGPVWNYLVRPWEEADLVDRFGLAFEHYHTHVRCWIPRFIPYRPNEP